MRNTTTNEAHAETVDAPNDSPDTNTVTRKPWQFGPGNNANPHGRPRKGQTIADRVAKADAAVARKALKARDKRLELTNAVGERAWSTYLAYNLGLPAQKYIISQGDAKADELDAILLANQGTRAAIEGEFVVQPQGETG